MNEEWLKPHDTVLHSVIASMGVVLSGLGRNDAEPQLRKFLQPPEQSPYSYGK